MSSIQSSNVGWRLAAMPPSMKIWRKIRPLLFRVLYSAQIYWNRRPRRVRLGRLVLRTDPAVFHPGQHFSSKILATSVASLNLQDCRVLDMGTGSGVIGVTAALRGAKVVAVDINPQAAKLAAANARDHQVEGKLRVACGDLFAPLSPTAKFDWIIFNPPFFPRPVEKAEDIALNAGVDYATIDRFLQQAKSFLSPRGKILLILSSDMDLAQLQNMIDRCHYQIVGNEIKPHFFELFYLVQLVTDY